MSWWPVGAELLLKGAEGKADREKYLLDNGYPAYTTGAGWIAYSDEKLTQVQATICRCCSSLTHSLTHSLTPSLTAPYHRYRDTVV